jgi:methionine synthase I (cobalamin-dependent)/5,10-methylenetetrahydrofolate reductase
MTRAELSGKILVCDGAMGTMLHAAGNSLDQALPALNRSNPDLVRTIHGSYISAGVDLIQTNTFGASRLRLAEYGLGDQAAEINRAGVRIARQVVPAGSGILVAGSVGPAVTVHQRRHASEAERRSSLREQIEALAGADVILLETFGFLNELLEAIAVAAEVSPLPVMAQATFGADERTLSGHTPRELAVAVGDTPAVTLGINCTLGPQGSLSVLRALREHTDLPLSVQPNAGLPRLVSPARFEYDVDSDYFARYIRHLLEAGAGIVGGCCGTTPIQLAAVVEIANGYRQRRSGHGTISAPPAVSAAGSGASLHDHPGRGVIAAELTAPSTGDAGETLETAAELGRLGVDFVAVTAAQTSRAQVSVLDLALHLHLQASIKTIATVRTWDRTIMALQADLLGAHALGLRRIICETGSPPLLGDYPHVDGVWDVDSIGLIELLANLNSGLDYYNLPLGAKAEFEVGARINPGSRALDTEISRTISKISAGATYLVTTPVYELSALRQLLAAVDGRVPVLATIRPLGSFAEADYLAHEVPDVIIPAPVLSAMERAGDAAAEAGLELAAGLVAELRHVTSGIVVAAGTDIVAATQYLLTC